MFMIGLELSISRLRSLGSKVFGLGSLQVLVTGAVIGVSAYSLGASFEAATIIGGGLALSSTAFVLQLLNERGERATRFGLATFSILLLQDIAVVPLLILVALLGADGASFTEAFGQAALKGVAALVVAIIFGRYLLRPLYRMIASMRNVELFVATTLLVVLGMGWLMTQAGLSMELGALAGRIAAGRNRTPPPDRGRYKTVSWHLAGAVFHQHRHVDQHRLYTGKSRGYPADRGGPSDQ